MLFDKISTVDETQDDAVPYIVAQKGDDRLALATLWEGYGWIRISSMKIVGMHNSPIDAVKHLTSKDYDCQFLLEPKKFFDFLDFLRE